MRVIIASPTGREIYLITTILPRVMLWARIINSLMVGVACVPLAIRPSRLATDYHLAIITMEIMSRMLQKDASAVLEEMISISTRLGVNFSSRRRSSVVGNTDDEISSHINAIPVVSYQFFPTCTLRRGRFPVRSILKL